MNVLETQVVQAPPHYAARDPRYEPRIVIREWELNFNLGNVLKYIYRREKKNDILADLRKARDYLNFEIEHLEYMRDNMGP